MPTLDSLHFRPTPTDGHPCTAYRSSFIQSSGISTNSQSHSHGRLGVDKALLIKALVISLVILFLLVPSVGFLHTEGLTFGLSAFSSIDFIQTFVVMFFVILVYDFLTARRRFFTQELYGSLAAAVILITSNLIVLQYTIVPLAIDILVLFVALYSAFWLCNRKKIRPVLQFLGVLFVLIIFAKFLLGASGSGFTGNVTGVISQGVHGLLLSYQINATWVHAFMENVSENRTVPLQESTYLDGIAKQRFIEMTTDGHYQITHYGAGAYDVGEVVFYPSGYSPNSYATDIRTTGPLHWQLLVSPEFGYYGYYIGNGPVVEAENYCGAPSELPGPGINVTQWYESYGCTPVVGNTTWLVIDLN